MEKRKWSWKKKPSERSPGESESSGSFSSHSERYSDEQQDALRESSNHITQSPEVTSIATIIDDEMKESVKCLTEKLSAALVNVSAKEDLVKQHAKVAEEAVAGWEKAENEVAALKQQLEAAVQQNLNLEVRASHLDGALKECVRQLRQARNEQEEKISDAILENNKQWETIKSDLEKRIHKLEAEAEASKAAFNDPNGVLIIEALEEENLSLKQQLASNLNELEILIIERDLSTQAAETASKLQLESNKKVVKLEAECRKLQTLVRKSSPVNNQKFLTPSPFYAESLTDSNTNGSEPGSDSWATALIAELDHFKNEKPSQKNLAAYSVEIDMMGDFLEMERLAALPETKSNTPFATSSASGECVFMDGSLRAELDSMTERVAELENKLERLEAEKLELENALNGSEGSLKAAQNKMAEAEIKLEELQKELIAVNEAKELLEFQLVGMEVEARTMSANVDSLTMEVEKEQHLSAELAVKCQELENELTRTLEESELANSNAEPKLKQEDLAVAADKLAECQKTIASLGRQLQSLATLEDFLIDTSNIPGLHSNGIFARKSESDPSRQSMSNSIHLEKESNEDSPLSSSLPTSSSDHVTSKSRNGFGRFFTRSKSVAELGNHQE